MRIERDVRLGERTVGRVQVQTYKEALERIYEKKVKKALLYFFHLDQFVEL